MKFRTRLGIAFLTILLVPLILSTTLVFGMLKYQLHAIDETYGITGTTIDNLSNSVQVMAKLTEQPYLELADAIHDDVEQMEDATYLDAFNAELVDKNAYLLVRKDNVIAYVGAENGAINIDSNTTLEMVKNYVLIHKHRSEEFLFVSKNLEKFMGALM